MPLLLSAIPSIFSASAFPFLSAFHAYLFFFSSFFFRVIKCAHVHAPTQMYIIARKSYRTLIWTHIHTNLYIHIQMPPQTTYTGVYWKWTNVCTNQPFDRGFNNTYITSRGNCSVYPTLPISRFLDIWISFIYTLTKQQNTYLYTQPLFHSFVDFFHHVQEFPLFNPFPCFTNTHYINTFYIKACHVFP